MFKNLDGKSKIFYEAVMVLYGLLPATLLGDLIAHFSLLKRTCLYLPALSLNSIVPNLQL